MVGARGLRAADSNGLSDPYVVVRLGDAAEQTRVVPECLDPDWNETFVFSAAQVGGMPCLSLHPSWAVCHNYPGNYWGRWPCPMVR